MYVKRNEQGEVIALSQYPETGLIEQLPDSAPEIEAFLRACANAANTPLAQSDQAMARVLEDVINLLVDQGTIRFTDLPEAAQVKLLSRRELRGQRLGMDLLDDGDQLNI